MSEIMSFETKEPEKRGSISQFTLKKLLFLFHFPIKFQFCQNILKI